MLFQIVFERVQLPARSVRVVRLRGYLRDWRNRKYQAAFMANDADVADALDTARRGIAAGIGAEAQSIAQRPNMRSRFRPRRESTP